MKMFLEKMYSHATDLNHRNILDLLEENPKEKFLDLGCDDGNVAIEMAKKIGTQNISGVEIVDLRIQLAEAKGVKVKKFDLNKKFKFENDSIDIIHSNQVIEHLFDSDMYVGEIYRILKTGGRTAMTLQQGLHRQSRASGISTQVRSVHERADRVRHHR